MTDDEQRKSQPVTDEQAAALHEPKPRKPEEHDEEESEKGLLESEQHSKAPGPFGTS